MESILWQIVDHQPRDRFIVRSCKTVLHEVTKCTKNTKILLEKNHFVIFVLVRAFVMSRCGSGRSIA